MNQRKKTLTAGLILFGFGLCVVFAMGQMTMEMSYMFEVNMIAARVLQGVFSAMAVFCLLKATWLIIKAIYLYFPPVGQKNDRTNAFFGCYIAGLMLVMMGLFMAFNHRFALHEYLIVPGIFTIILGGGYFVFGNYYERLHRRFVRGPVVLVERDRR